MPVFSYFIYVPGEWNKSGSVKMQGRFYALTDDIVIKGLWRKCRSCCCCLVGYAHCTTKYLNRLAGAIEMMERSNLFLILVTAFPAVCSLSCVSELSMFAKIEGKFKIR